MNGSAGERACVRHRALPSVPLCVNFEFILACFYKYVSYVVLIYRIMIYILGQLVRFDCIRHSSYLPYPLVASGSMSNRLKIVSGPSAPISGFGLCLAVVRVAISKRGHPLGLGHRVDRDALGQFEIRKGVPRSQLLPLGHYLERAPGARSNADEYFF